MMSLKERTCSKCNTTTYIDPNSNMKVAKGCSVCSSNEANSNTNYCIRENGIITKGVYIPKPRQKATDAFGNSIYRFRSENENYINE